jgi:hypothetical protein
VLGPAIPNTVTTVTWEKIQVQSSKYSFYWLPTAFTSLQRTKL